MNGWSYYWVAWLLAFIGPELYAAISNARQGTLSNNVWALEHLNLSQPFDFAMWTDVHWAVAVIVWGLFLWLSLHIPFGLLR